MNEDFLWVDKYRPSKVDDVVLPERLKKPFRKYVEDKKIPNLLLVGGAGVGKTTMALAAVREIGADYLFINGSLEGRSIDILRNEILQFASAVSLMGGRKYVIIDEADYLNAQSLQPALRGFIEEFSDNCGFIMTCNFKNKLIEPLWSRNANIDFRLEKKEKQAMAAQFFKTAQVILKNEGVDFEPKVLSEVIMKYFPDYRRVLNELQHYSASGKIDKGILVNLQDEQVKELFKFLKEKNFTEMRKWVVHNLDNDINQLFRAVYDKALSQLEPASVPQMVLIIADYQYKSAFVVDQEINAVACFTELMSDCKWKE